MKETIQRKLNDSAAARWTALVLVALMMFFGYMFVDVMSPIQALIESQRVKLATELSKRDTGQTIYILDEPTTGLHFEDIRVLMDVLQRLVNRGNTVIVIEHNLDVIKVADYLIDMGPEGGRGVPRFVRRFRQCGA